MINFSGLHILFSNRHQFRQEEGQKHRQKRKREHTAEGAKKAETADES